jgi:hypothetical protein
VTAPPGAEAGGEAAGDPGAARFTPPEERALRAAVAAGEAPACPRCAVRLTQRPLGGGSFGLGYRRQRTWLLCPSCRRSAIFDVRRGTRL